MLKQEQIDEAIQRINNNEILILPTDTIYGLSARYDHSNEIRINGLKNADLEKPLIILISDIKQAEMFAHIDESISEILNSVQPTTVVFGNGVNTFGVRKVLREDLVKIISETGPIYSTSVNFSGNKPLRTQDELANFSEEVTLFFDEILNGQPSRIYNSITKEWIR